MGRRSKREIVEAIEDIRDMLEDLAGNAPSVSRYLMACRVALAFAIKDLRKR